MAQIPPTMPTQQPTSVPGWAFRGRRAVRLASVLGTASIAALVLAADLGEAVLAACGGAAAPLIGWG